MNQIQQFFRNHLKGAAEVIATDSYVTFKRVPTSTEPKHGHNFMATDVASQGSGVRLDFETDASQLELSVAFDAFLWPGLPEQPVQLVVEVNDRILNFAQSNLRYVGFPDFNRIGELKFETLTVDLGNDIFGKRVTVWFPHNATSYVSKLELNGTAQPFNSGNPKWVHYGSSISHSGEAKFPTGVWPVIASKNLDLDLVNLGLGGNALADPYMAKVILDHNPDFLSMKLGINSVNGAGHTLRTFIPAVYGLIESLTEKKPDLKILLISPIFCPPHEEGFGPTIFDMEAHKATANPNPAPEMVPANLNLKRIRAALEQIVKDLQTSGVDIKFLSGLELLNEADAHLLEDDLHPNSEGYELMGERFSVSPAVQNWLGRS